jgi:hypothetical protein
MGANKGIIGLVLVVFADSPGLPLLLIELLVCPEIAM